MYQSISFSSVHHVRYSCTLMKESNYLREMMYTVDKDVCYGKDKMF